MLDCCWLNQFAVTISQVRLAEGSGLPDTKDSALAIGGRVAVQAFAYLMCSTFQCCRWQIARQCFILVMLAVNDQS